MIWRSLGKGITKDDPGFTRFDRWGREWHWRIRDRAKWVKAHLVRTHLHLESRRWLMVLEARQGVYSDLILFLPWFPLSGYGIFDTILQFPFFPCCHLPPLRQKLYSQPLLEIRVRKIVQTTVLLDVRRSLSRTPYRLWVSLCAAN